MLCRSVLSQLASRSSCIVPQAAAPRAAVEQRGALEAARPVGTGAPAVCGRATDCRAIDHLIAELRAAADGEARGVALARGEEAVHQPLRERQPVGGERQKQPHAARSVGERAEGADTARYPGERQGSRVLPPSHSRAELFRRAVVARAVVALLAESPCRCDVGRRRRAASSRCAA
eukprot:scaffold11735_cov56-Phaeocystis_antarctica.AAC.6